MNADFVRTVSDKYRAWCDKMETKPTIEGFARYLLEREVIRQRTAARYMVYEYYPRALYDNEGAKKPACLEVAVLTGICESTVWSMVNHRPGYFAPRAVAWSQGAMY